MKRTIKAMTIVAYGVALLLQSASGHDHATGVVKERMDGMQKMAKRMKAINERLKNNRDLSAVQAHAEAIGELSSHIVDMFPPGSTERPTQARRTIWQNWADFEKKADAAQAASKKLAASSAGDLGALQTLAAAVTQTCLACHEKYRTKR